ncbi:60S/50S RIBOSOMAL PROTEIN L6/L9 [Salix viminalis]|nr:60S/50S RIBOSOMAL PROTEIN L6/L9 [Salix viminalis]
MLVGVGPSSESLSLGALVVHFLLALVSSMTCLWESETKDDINAKVSQKELKAFEWYHFAMEAKFFRFLKIVGVGYKARAEAEGRLLFLKLGYSHEVELTVPPAVRVFCFKNNVVCCTGIDKGRVHQFAASVRSCKPPEVYKGKGIMYIDEVIKKKQGKKSK